MAELELELIKARKVVADLETVIVAQADEGRTKPSKPELPKPQRFLTADEAIQFLGLRSKSALTYLHGQPDGPPFVRLTKRRRVYALADLIAWAETRKTSKK